MQNKIICLIILIFLNACGYTPLYQNNSNLNFSIEITELEGDRKVNEAIKSNLRRFSKKSNEKINYEIKIKTNLTKKTISKNKTGTISQIKLITKVTFIVKSNELEKTFLFSEEFKTWATPYSEEIPRMASTWFFIKAIRGDTTIAVPSSINAGSW